MITSFGTAVKKCRMIFTWFLVVAVWLSVMPLGRAAATADSSKLYEEVPSGAVLVSQGATVTAYNGMVVHDGPQSNLTDGDLGTLSGGTLGFVDLYLDLGQSSPLNYVQINFNRHWTGVNTVYVSDNATDWTEVVTGDGSIGKYEYMQNTSLTDILQNNIFGAVLPDNTAGRYVRIRAQQDYVNINEIQVYSQVTAASKEFAEVPPGTRLVSQGAPVTAYNGMVVHDGPQSNLTDGDLTTLSGGALGFVDLYLDLGQSLSLNYVQINFNRHWTGINTVYVSDNATDWTEVVTGDGSIGKYEYMQNTSLTDLLQNNIFGAVLPDNTAGRYVRIRAQQDYVNINEIQVYSSQVFHVQQLKVEGSATKSVVQGFSMQMIAKALPEQATDKSVTWSVSPKAGSAGTASIDAATGFLTAITAGVVTVEATTNDGSAITASVDVVIDPAVEKWRNMEFSLTSSKTYANPFMDVDVTATFTGPNGEKLIRPAFWDGGNTWKVRFAPTAVGSWIVTTQSTDASDTGLNRSTPIPFTSVEYNGTLDIYKRGFLKSSETKRYFSYNDGTPFFYLGDTHWFMPSEDFEASNVEGIDSQFKYAVDHRVSQGFTVYQSEPLFTNGNYLDVSRGIVPSSLARLQDMDRKFQYIADAGLVHANAALTFRSLLNVTDPALLEKLGKYWQARFGAFPVLWTTAQEVDPGHEFNDYWHKVAKSIYDNDAYHQPLTAHMEGGDALNTGWGDKYYHSWFGVQPSNLQKDGYQTFWEYAITKPYIAYETGYEFNRTSTDVARSVPYKAFANGAFGFGYGAQGVWALNDSPDNWFPYGPYYRWFDGLNAFGGYQMIHFKNFYQSLQWWKLTPAFRDTTYADFTRKDHAYLLNDGDKTYIAYFAETNKTTGKLKQMANTVYKAEWYNTRTGEYTLISNQVTPVDGQWVIPAKPDDSDWILLVTSSQSALERKLVVSSANQATTINKQHDTLQMSAAVNVEHTAATVLWQVTNVDGSVTDAAAIDQNGLLTSLNNGHVRVTATEVGSGLTASKTVIITRQDQASPPAKAQSLTIADGGAPFAGNKQLLPYFVPSNTWDQRVEWAVYELDGVTPTDKALISPFGILTVLKEGTVKVIATAMDGSGVQGSYDYPIHFEITNPLFAGAEATASSSDYGNDYTPVKAILSKHGAFEGWSSSADVPTSYDKPDWLQVKFAQPTALNHIEVYTTGYGFNMKDFDVQYWDGSQWVNLYSIKGNTNDVIKVLFPEITTTQIRVICYKGDSGGISRIDSIEVYKDAESHDARLSGITVDGKALDGFTADKTSYNMELPANTTVVPNVAATAADSRATVSVTQAAAIPGTAVISVKAEDGATTGRYEINYTLKSSEPGSHPPIIPSTSNNGSAGKDQVVDAAELIELLSKDEHAELQLTGETVLLPASALTKGKSLTVVYDGVSYTLPLEKLKLNALAEELGVELKDMSIKVEMKKLTGDDLSSLRKAAEAEQIALLTDGIDFKVFAVSKDGKSMEIKSYGSSYVSRTLVVPGSVDAVKDTGAVYDPVSRTFSFVPSVFVSKDGLTTATLIRNSNSIYTVIRAKEKTFTDIAGHWAKADIELLTNKLIVNGVTKSSFEPDRRISRAEFAALAVRALGLSGGATPAIPLFSDVNAGDWYADDVAMASQAGLINGYKDGTFRPEKTITRVEMAAIIVRMLRFSGQDVALSTSEQATVLSGYNDAAGIGWGMAELAYAVKFGIIEGTGNRQTLNIEGQATRAQSAAVLKRALIKAGFIGF